VRPGTIATLRLRLSRRDLQRAARALRAGRRVTATVRIRVMPAGDASARTIVRRVRVV
jgi:hypothetical protein